MLKKGKDNKTYIYGKTMEMAGNKKETMRGCQASNEANHHTDLVHRSREALKKLSTANR